MSQTYPHLGIDFDAGAGPGLDFLPDMRTTMSGRKALALAIANRLMTPHAWWPFAQDMGYDLRQYIGAADVDTDEVEDGIREESLKSERVLDCSATVTIKEDEERMIAEIELTDHQGPFRFVLEIDKFRARLLTEDL